MLAMTHISLWCKKHTHRKVFGVGVSPTGDSEATVRLLWYNDLRLAV